LQSVQLERGLRIVNPPGVIFEYDDSIQGQKESSALLRHVVKPEDVDDPISMLELLTLLGLNTGRLLAKVAPRHPLCGTSCPH